MRAKKVLITAVAAGALFGITGAVFAATGFEVPGTAKASGQVGTVVPTTGAGTIVGAIYPGHSNDCDITFANANSVDVVITEIKGDGYVVQSGSGAGQSEGPGVSVTPFGTINDVSGLNILVPKNGTKEAVIGGCLTAGDVPTDAQGTQFTLHFTTVGASA